MLGLGKAGTVHASATVSPARSQEIYQRYAVALYRQALLNPGDPAPAGHVGCAPVVNECALAAMPERGEDDARYRLAESAFRRSRQPAFGPAQPDRRSGPGALGLVLPGALGHIRASAVPGIRPREMAALLRAVLRKLATSPPAAGDRGPSRISRAAAASGNRTGRE